MRRRPGGRARWCRRPGRVAIGSDKLPGTSPVMTAGSSANRFHQTIAVSIRLTGGIFWFV